MTKTLQLASYAAAAAFLLNCGGQTFAQIAYNNAVGSGNWGVPATWSAGEPTDATPVAIDGGRTVTIDQFGEETNLLDVGTISSQAGTLTMTGGDLFVSDPSATEPNLPSIRIGQAAGATGTFNLSGGAVFIEGPDADSGFGVGDLMIGDLGNGTMNMTGGEIHANDEIIIANAPSSTGVVSVSAGTFETDAQGRSILVGFGGNGTLNVSGTGLVRANFDMLVGFLEGSTATINQSGGTIEAGFLFTNSFTGGTGSTVNMTMTGGTYNARLAYVLGQGRGTTTLTHSAGAINAPSNNGDVVISDGGGNTSTYNISGTATVNALHNFFVGAFEGSNGTVNQTGGTITAGDNFFIGRDGNGAWNMNGGINNATNVFLGDFDSSNGTLNVQAGTIHTTGNFNVGAALASNAAPDRVEPNGSNGPQGQALDANGILNVIGSAGIIDVDGNFLANPKDKSPARSGVGQENDALLKFTLGSTGISTIDVGLKADLDGAVIDIDDTAGYFTANPAAQLTLMTVQGSFGNVTTVTPAEQVVGPAGAGKNFTQAAGDTGVFTLQILANPGGGERLVLTKAIGGGFAADFDNDGDVDGNDLTVWRNNFGPTDPDADADNDNDSDGTDFLIWQRQSGSQAAAPVAAAVPEPSAALLLSIAVAAFAIRRK